MKLKKFGFLINKIDNSPLSKNLINCINILSLQPYIDIIIFRVEQTPMKIWPNCSIMNVSEVWGYDGICISTDIKTTEILIEAACPKEKYFYIWNLEWLYDSDVIYNKYNKIYNNKDIKLITRSDSHNKAITEAWQKPTTNWEDYNVQQFKSIFGI